MCKTPPKISAVFFLLMHIFSFRVHNQITKYQVKGKLKMMLKGCQKNVIMLRATDSDIFEEAFFVLKRDAELDCKLKDSDMISEAKRILEANTANASIHRKGNIKSAVICFSVGAVSAFCVSALLGIFLFVI